MITNDVKPIARFDQSPLISFFVFETHTEARPTPQKLQRHAAQNLSLLSFSAVQQQHFPQHVSLYTNQVVLHSTNGRYIYSQLLLKIQYANQEMTQNLQ